MLVSHTPPRSGPIWTVGHSNHAFDDLARLLAGQRIEVVVDVRSFPYSRFAPQFNRDDVEQSLRAAGVRYLFMGEELGGRPQQPAHYDAEGHALYGPMAEGAAFQRSIDRLLDGSHTHRIALMCSEGNPHECHRRLLVGKVLAERGVTLRHILPDGSVFEEHEVALGGGDYPQALLFQGDTAWRSTRSVSRRRRPRTSSAA